MKSERPAGSWMLAAVLLAAVVIVGGVIIAVRLGESRPVEITLTNQPAVQGTIYVGGEVNNPGYYPLHPGDKVEDILAAAGGPTDGADSNDLQLRVSPAGAGDAPQKIDINRAEVWLLEALPGIGEARAQAIIDYRRIHGPFRDIYELTKVPGFGEATVEAIKDFITVAEN
jgi:competence protein ComEA